MTAPAALRDRLPSAAAAIALQAALFALLALSYEAVRKLPQEKETILNLPPLPAPEPVMVDARRKTLPRPSAPPAPPPVWSTPGVAFRGGQKGIELAPPAGPDCPPQNYVNLNPGDRKACAPAAQSATRPDTATVERNPPSHVKDAARWQSEIDRRNTPPRLPCVSLTNSVVGMGGFEKEDHGARLDIVCALKAWRAGPALLPPLRGAPDPNPPHAHASDDAFGKALQAVNARKRTLYPGPAPAPDTTLGASP